VRTYNYYDDGLRNTVAGSTTAADHPCPIRAAAHRSRIVDEHWSYAIRSAPRGDAAMGGTEKPEDSRPLWDRHNGLNAFDAVACQACSVLAGFDEIRCTSRRPETRRAFADQWSRELGIPGSAEGSRSRKSCAAPTSWWAVPLGRDREPRTLAQAGCTFILAGAA